jgi:hypothetical protein
MKWNTLLIKYMKEKNVIIRKYSGLVLTRYADMQELLKWDESRCKKALVGIFCGVGIPSTCPWCYTADNCECCGYGKRNGRCTTEQGSRYSRITRAAGIAVLEMPEMLTLLWKYKAKVKRKLAREGE